MNLFDKLLAPPKISFISTSLSIQICEENVNTGSGLKYHEDIIDIPLVTYGFHIRRLFCSDFACMRALYNFLFKHRSSVSFLIFLFFIT